jgi:hypothetical protein
MIFDATIGLGLDCEGAMENQLGAWPLLRSYLSDILLFITWEFSALSFTLALPFPNQNPVPKYEVDQLSPLVGMIMKWAAALCFAVVCFSPQCSKIHGNHHHYLFYIFLGIQVNCLMQLYDIEVGQSSTSNSSLFSCDLLRTSNSDISGPGVPSPHICPNTPLRLFMLTTTRQGGLCSCRQ